MLENFLVENARRGRLYLSSSRNTSKTPVANPRGSFTLHVTPHGALSQQEQASKPHHVPVASLQESLGWVARQDGEVAGHLQQPGVLVVCRVPLLGHSHRLSSHDIHITCWSNVGPSGAERVTIVLPSIPLCCRVMFLFSLIFRPNIENKVLARRHLAAVDRKEQCSKTWRTRTYHAGSPC